MKVAASDGLASRPARQVLTTIVVFDYMQAKTANPFSYLLHSIPYI